MVNDMTEQEKLMYDLLGKISSSDIPLIFKGGLITNLVLRENGFENVKRATIDIDANWIDNPPTMEHLVEAVKSSLGDLINNYDIVPFRSYGERKSAGLNVIDRVTNAKIISMDIEIKPTIGSRLYFWKNTSIKGVLPNEIITDKICSVSTDLVYKHRAKDLIDTYMLSNCLDISTKEIYNLCVTKERSISSFDGLVNKKDAVEHAYNKLKRIEGKPSFDELYFYLMKFLKPFIEKDLAEKHWNSKQTSWEDEKHITNEKHDVRGLLKKKAQEISKQPHKEQQPQNDKKKNDQSL